MQCGPCKGHVKGLDGDRVEIQDSRIEINGRQGAAGDHHSLEFFEDWLDRQACIQAAELGMQGTQSQCHLLICGSADMPCCQRA